MNTDDIRETLRSQLEQEVVEANKRLQVAQRELDAAQRSVQAVTAELDNFNMGARSHGRRDETPIDGQEAGRN